jgi:carboxypeptidase T
MIKLVPRRLLLLALAIAPLLLAVVGWSHSGPVKAGAHGLKQRLAQDDADRRARQADLRTRLSGIRPSDFLDALRSLESLDEQGALDLWTVATHNPNPQLSKLAWQGFASARGALSKKEVVPQIARVSAGRDVVATALETAGIELHVFVEDAGGVIIAAPPYGLDRLRRDGLTVTELFDSVAQLQQAARRGDSLARSLDSSYQSQPGFSPSDYQVRVAVVDLRTPAKPVAGYSNWLGDPENVLMRNESWLAYLDTFVSDGSESSINSHINEQYTKRGYRIEGVFTTGEFATAVGRFFPGKTFSAGNGVAEARNQGIQAQLANGKYHSYDDALNEFTALAQAHPDIAQMFNLGQSFEGRKIFGLKISRNAAATDPTKPDVLITGAHHAREWISVEPPMYFANQLISGYGVDDSITYFVDHLQIWIIPVVNPDGLTYSQQSSNFAADTIRLWRKNRQPINAKGSCFSGIGVDLNRNYNFEWRLPGDQPCPSISDDVGASDDPNNETYRGPSPESELEVKALDSLTDDPNHHFLARLDYHNFQELVLYPWGYQSGPAQDSATLSELGKRIRDLAQATTNEFYTSEQAIDLYITTGMSVDYAYAVDKVPAPYVIELRPQCCDFAIPESEILPINQESWAGARMLLNWSAGVPILRQVQAYQIGSDGTFSRQVYSARWVDTPGGRNLFVDVRFPAMDPGPLQVRLQFSKPMDPSSQPAVSLGRAAPFTEINVAAANSSEGWQKTVYQNDTWVGETIVPQSSDPNPWRLSVSATDATPFNLDGNPGTVASYALGTGAWQNYEDASGVGATGGADIRNVLPPTLQSSLLGITVDAPTGGERLAGGDLYTVAWTIPKGLSFTPAQEQVTLSTDSGISFTSIAEGISGSVNSFTITVPRIASIGARIKMLAQDVTTGNLIFGETPSNFTIGANVGTAVDVQVTNTQIVDQGWTDTPPAGQGTAATGDSRLVIDLSIANHGALPIANPFFRTSTLERGNVLLSRDGNSPQATGGRQSVDPGSDGLLGAGKTAQARLVVGLVTRKKFSFLVDFYGVPIGGSIVPASSFQLWHGKPR